MFGEIRCIQSARQRMASKPEPGLTVPHQVCWSNLRKDASTIGRRSVRQQGSKYAWSCPCLGRGTLSWGRDAYIACVLVCQRTAWLKRLIYPLCLALLSDSLSNLQIINWILLLYQCLESGALDRKYCLRAESIHSFNKNTYGVSTMCKSLFCALRNIPVNENRPKTCPQKAYVLICGDYWNK